MFNNIFHVWIIHNKNARVVTSKRQELEMQGWEKEKKGSEED